MLDHVSKHVSTLWHRQSVSSFIWAGQVVKLNVSSWARGQSSGIQCPREDWDFVVCLTGV